jgi:DNA polymerase-3 subunit gamma/tau
MGYTALYRQYRPVVFDQVVGQQHITTTIKNQVTGDKVAHAYLFAGTRGTGKTSTARIFARAVNCSDVQNGNPCNSCEICGRALSGKLMDIIEIDAASNRGVDEIRDLREKVKYPPAEGRYRVYIVDEVHMLTAEAFNALLKTLEEPPSHVIFILATTEPHKLPATVLSRCQRFDFKRLSVSEITELLRHIVEKAGIKIDRDAIELIAGSADGAARDAISLLDQCSTFEQGDLTLDRVTSILGTTHDRLLFGLSEGFACGDAAGCIELLSMAVKDGRDIGQLFKDIIHHLRDILIAKVSPSGIRDMSAEKTQGLLAMADRMEVNSLIRAINVLSEAEAKAKWSTYPGILLEVAVVKMCEPSMDASLEGLIDRLSRLEDIVSKQKVLTANPDKGKASAPDDREPIAADDREKPQRGSAGEQTPEDENRSGHESRCKPGEADGTRPESKNETKPGEEAQEKTADSQSSRKEIALEQITSDWDKVLKRLEKSKKGLYTLLMNSRPVHVNGTALVIECEALHGIYRDILSSETNRKALTDAVFSATGVRFEIKIESNDSKQGPKGGDTQEAVSLYEEAVGIFGSDLVEALDDKDN